MKNKQIKMLMFLILNTSKQICVFFYLIVYNI